MKDNIIVNLIGAYILIWTLLLIAIPIYVYQAEIINDPLLKSLIYISCAGGLGGVVYLVRSFIKHIFEQNFRTDVFWWYIFRPFTSMIIGAISYFLIVGGLLSLGSVSSVDYEKSVMFYCGVSFLAGFSFTQFADKLEELAKTLFSKPYKDKK